MNQRWKTLSVKEIALAIYVAPGMGDTVHKNRAFHGLVINAEDSVKDYVFSNGTVLHTEGCSLFYLPKGSSYVVDAKMVGGCYAINFDADLSDEPFAVSLRNSAELTKSFLAATSSWKRGDDAKIALSMRAIYDAVFQMLEEKRREYLPSDRYRVLAPAEELLESDYTSSTTNVGRLAALSGVSEVYFRRIFQSKYGVSPKEYLVRRRIAYAKELLSSGHFSVSEVARLSGYSELCHFSREFKRRVGVSPTEFGK